MRQRASSAAALFTAAVLGRVTTASAFVHPAQILHQHTTFAQHPVHIQTGSRRLTAFSPARRQPHRRFSAFLSDGSKAHRGGHDGEGGEVWPRVLVVARVMTGALQAPSSALRLANPRSSVARDGFGPSTDGADGD